MSKGCNAQVLIMNPHHSLTSPHAIVCNDSVVGHAGKHWHQGFAHTRANFVWDDSWLTKPHVEPDPPVSDAEVEAAVKTLYGEPPGWYGSWVNGRAETVRAALAAAKKAAKEQS